jgi:hypothetical protein
MTLVKRIGGLRRFEARAVRKFVVATITRQCAQAITSRSRQSDQGSVSAGKRAGRFNQP